jgi:hypothetical protein
MIIIKRPIINNKSITYSEVVDHIKNNFNPSIENIEQYLKKQEIMIGRLLFSLDNKTIYRILINELEKTKAKAYFKTLKDFKIVMEDYFGGALLDLVEIKNRIEDTDKNIIGEKLDSTLFHFRKLRYQFTDFLISRKIENLYYCVDRLSRLKLETNLNVNYDENLMILYKHNKDLIFELTCKVFPENSKVLTILYGNKK